MVDSEALPEGRSALGFAETRESLLREAIFFGAVADLAGDRFDQRGLEAIDRIRKITAGRFTFSDTVVDRVASADLPPTADLLSLLDANGAAPTIPAAPAPPPRPPDAAPRPVAPPPPQAAASPELVKAQAVIEAELTEFVGPIAPLLCRGHITRAAAAGSPLDLPALVEAVAREIGDRAKEDRFTQQTLARLREP